MFCQQDRAILCKECDLPIHSANEHTQKHDRFLLTGVKLSSAAKLYSSTTPSNSVPDYCVSNSKSQSSVNNSVLDNSSNVSHPPLIAKTTPSAASTLPPSCPTINKAGGSLVAIEGGGSTSANSIPEYLIETLPGWQVEDFLDSYSVPFGFCKGDDMLPLFDADIEGNHPGSFLPESMGIWVPQAPPPLYSSQMDRQIENRETKEATNVKGNRSRLRDDHFLVPQISPGSNNSKRPRFLW